MDILIFLALAVVVIIVVDFVETRGKKYGNFEMQQDTKTSSAQHPDVIRGSLYRPDSRLKPGPSQFIDTLHPLYDEQNPFH